MSSTGLGKIEALEMSGDKLATGWKWRAPQCDKEVRWMPQCRTF